MRLHAQFYEVREPRRWLYRTVHNMALNQRRRSDKVIPLQPITAGEPCPDYDCTDPELMPDEHLIRWEGIGLVRLSLSRLDVRAREVVRLKFTEDLSYKEIAGQTGLTVGNVGFILHHALKTIASELARSGLIP